MKKLALLFLLSVAVYGNIIDECSNGNIMACKVLYGIRKYSCLDGDIEACKQLYRALTNECKAYANTNTTLCKEISNVIIKKCLDGTTEACESLATSVIKVYSYAYSYKNELPEWLDCKDYMKTIRKGCNLGSGLCCALLGNEFHSISIKYGDNWRAKYGANCSLRNQDEAFKYYKKACDLGESYGCKQYTELQDDISEIDRRERDKTYKGDITVRQR